MTKPVLNPANNGHSKGSKLYDHSITTNNALPKYQQPNHYGFPPALDHNKSSRLEYQQDSQELRIATIAALSQQIKSKDINVSIDGNIKIKQCKISRKIELLDIIK